MRAPQLAEVNRKGLTLLVAEELTKKGITVAFSTRLGGVSEGPYAELNLAYRVGDSAEKVSANRELLCGALDLALDRLTCAEQVHGNVVVRVDGNLAGRGAGPTGAIPAADGMITDLEGVPLAILTADCAPIILVDPAKGAVGAVHAGWRGTIAGIAFVAASRMARAGADPEEMLAFIGPSIGPCCYEVSEELASNFEREFGEAARPAERRVDLAAANRIALERAGLRTGAIVDAGICTCCRSDLFFSYRAHRRVTGRQAAIAAVNRK